jgi:hypothetical protein
MKLFILTCLVAVIYVAAGCNGSRNVPQCVQTIIDANKGNAKWEVGRVEEYEFQGKMVYAFQPDARIITDGATTILTANCDTLCHVGGFGGPAVNSCNGENFFEKSVLKRKIWEK